MSTGQETGGAAELRQVNVRLLAVRWCEPADEPTSSPCGQDRAIDRAIDRSTSRTGDRTGAGSTRPFVLVHGLASNARTWDGVALRLATAGHLVIAVDQRGHGRSDEPDTGYTTDTCADDVAALIAVLGLVGSRTPIVVGQSWGGNVVLSLAVRHPGIAAAVACVDGGWIRLGERFATFEDCWARLAPPRLDGTTYARLATRLRAEHQQWPPEGSFARCSRPTRSTGTRRSRCRCCCARPPAPNRPPGRASPRR